MPFIGPDADRAVILGRLNELQQQAHAPELQRETALRAALTTMLRHARDHSDYWKSVMDASDALARADAGDSISEILAALPILTRAHLIQAGDRAQAVSAQMRAENITHTSTSGSTSEPVSVAVYQPTYAPTLHAITMLDWLWHERQPGTKTAVIRLGVTNSDAEPVGPPMSYLGSFQPLVLREVAGMSVDEMVDVIRIHRPDYLLINPLSIELMARSTLAHGWTDVRLQQVITLADRVTDSLRDLVRRAIGAEIKDRYSCEEVGFIALQCPKHDWYHVVEPAVLVEIVDDAGEPCAVGTPGRVLVTTLVNPATPLFRYDLGDVAEWGPACDCGITWPVIRQIHGRVRRYITTPDGRQVYATFIESPFADVAGLLEFRVVLHRDGLLLEYVAIHALDDDVLTEIAEYLRATFGYPWPVAIERVEAISERGQWKRHEFETSDEPLPDRLGATRY